MTPQVDAQRTMATLQSLPGIGQWTAQYIAMRALAWPDAFPHTDYAVKKVLDEQNPAKILERATVAAVAGLCHDAYLAVIT